MQVTSAPWASVSLPGKRTGENSSSKDRCETRTSLCVLCSHYWVRIFLCCRQLRWCLLFPREMGLWACQCVPEWTIVELHLNPRFGDQHMWLQYCPLELTASSSHLASWTNIFSSMKWRDNTYLKLCQNDGKSCGKSSAQRLPHVCKFSKYGVECF